MGFDPSCFHGKTMENSRTFDLAIFNSQLLIISRGYEISEEIQQNCDVFCKAWCQRGLSFRFPKTHPQKPEMIKHITLLSASTSKIWYGIRLIKVSGAWFCLKIVAPQYPAFFFTSSFLEYSNFAIFRHPIVLFHSHTSFQFFAYIPTFFLDNYPQTDIYT